MSEKKLLAYRSEKSYPILCAGLSLIAWIDLFGVWVHSKTAAASLNVNLESKSLDNKISTYKRGLVQKLARILQQISV